MDTKKITLLLSGIAAMIMAASSVSASTHIDLSHNDSARQGEKVEMKIRCEKNTHTRIEFGDNTYTYSKCDSDDKASTWHQYGCKSKETESTYTVRAVDQFGEVSEKHIKIVCNSSQDNHRDDEKNNDSQCKIQNASVSTQRDTVKGGERVQVKLNNFGTNTWTAVQFGDGSKVDLKTNTQGDADTWHVYECSTQNKSYRISAQSKSCSVSKSVEVRVNACSTQTQPTPTPTRTSDSSSVPSCPAGTELLFDSSTGSTINKGSKTKFDGVVTDVSKTWVLQSVNNQTLIKADDTNPNNIDLAVQFPQTIRLDSVLIFDNDPKAGEHYWRVNGIELNHRAPGDQDNKWAPLQTINQSVQVISLDTGGDSTHINFCVSGSRIATPTPTRIPTHSPTPTRVPTITPSKTPTPTQTQSTPWIEVMPNPSACVNTTTEKVLVKLHAFNPNQYVHVEFGDGSYVDTYVDASGNGITDHIYTSLNQQKTYTIRVVNMSTGVVVTKPVTVLACSQVTPTPTQPPAIPCKDLSVRAKITLDGQTIERDYATGVGPFYPVHDAGTASVDQLFEFTANFSPILSRYWQGQYIDVKPNYWDMKSGSAWMSHFFLKGFHSVDENQMRSVALSPVNGDMVTQIAYIPGQETFVTKDASGNMCGVIFEQDLDPPVVMTSAARFTAAPPQRMPKAFN